MKKTTLELDKGLRGLGGLEREDGGEEAVSDVVGGGKTGGELKRREQKERWADKGKMRATGGANRLAWSLVSCKGSRWPGFSPLGKERLAPWTPALSSCGQKIVTKSVHQTWGENVGWGSEQKGQFEVTMGHETKDPKTTLVYRATGCGHVHIKL